MATRAADMMFQCVFNGSLSLCDMDIEQRPYHRNCKCALHTIKDKCPHAGLQQRNISFPKREFRNNCSISVSTSTISCQYSYGHNSLTRIGEFVKKGSARL